MFRKKFEKKLFSNVIIISHLTIMTCMVSGCDETRRVFGQTKLAPDEFTVYRRAPLNIPPDFSLRPPNPGAKRLDNVDPHTSVGKTLGVLDSGRDKRSKKNLKYSSGEAALLQLFETDRANPNIRKLIERETASLYEKDKTITDKMLFWATKPKFGTALDPVKEKKRIEQNQVLGKKINSGEVPIISRKTKSKIPAIWR